jgi:hypothetical protein
MNKEYLEDYGLKERVEHERYWRDIQKQKLTLGKDKYPSDERFVKLKNPVASLCVDNAEARNFWTQIPFSGSTIIPIPPIPLSYFEKCFFKASEIPKVIDFIKETGKIQIALSSPALVYEDLDYLDPFFEELEPPELLAAPLSVYWNEEDIKKASTIFDTLGKIRFFSFLKKRFSADASPVEYSPGYVGTAFLQSRGAFMFLKLGRYAIVDDIENLMVDSPEVAYDMLYACQCFIVAPLVDTRCSIRNFSLEGTKISRPLPLVYQPQNVRFPCEIGGFLFEKLTYAPIGLDACKELIYHYDMYDLQKVQESLNEGITSNYPDVIKKSAKEISEILDDIWNDKTIPRRVKGIRIGVPLLMAAIGTVAAGPIGAVGGFLGGLGYAVLDRSVDLGTEGISEKLARLRTRNYQANVYDFKKKYGK